MRFHKHVRHPFTDTPRKRAALLRKQRLEREAFPLFADEIGEAQPGVEEVMTAREEHWLQREIEARAARAAKWLEVRASIAQLPAHERALFLEYWNNHRWYPADPSYCSTVLHMYRKGELIEHDGKLVSRAEHQYQKGLELQCREASEQELEQIIQSNMNMKLVEYARMERNRRWEAKR